MTEGGENKGHNLNDADISLPSTDLSEGSCYLRKKRLIFKDGGARNEIAGWVSGDHGRQRSREGRADRGKPRRL
jgi:hypothetical protein